jgi:DNA-binding transcriptional regulator YdaS (Cro superfamily)
MDLKTYIADADRRSDLLKKTGISRVYLWQLANGKRNASVKLASEIEKATDGQVTRERLLFGEAA